MIKVSLKPRHPTGTYRRAGHKFTISAPSLFEKLDAKTLAIFKNDGWLNVEEVAAEPKASAAKSDIETKKERNEKN